MPGAAFRDRAPRTSSACDGPRARAPTQRPPSVLQLFGSLALPQPALARFRHPNREHLRCATSNSAISPPAALPSALARAFALVAEVAKRAAACLAPIPWAAEA